MVHTSLIANGLWSASCIAAAKFAHGSDFSNYPNLAARSFTRELYETADGRWLQFTMVRSDEEIEAFLRALDVVELLADDRFASAQARTESGSALADELKPVIEARTAAEWMAIFADAGIPASLVGSIHDLPDDPQLVVNGIIAEPVDDIGADYVINHPINVDAADRIGAKRAPEVGEHTDPILADLGFSADAIAELRAAGVV